ncbi:VOC family protein [Mucilaginibacter psychrotolerans]|uniref:VOC domain-containing protein n=1 Tax=Mucilaginibacter psychrotolerans TaxID=1524096 RepID=A0A4Y8SN80_9SPHI|nr:VOC family protein [Mucilaginibacter psychrotolerans]TFF40302.1 hypothetical protein E2R66_03370 [Mucilaginibacter psychrotolerans]
MQNLNSVSPFFIVADLKASLGFYEKMLGFAIWHIAPADEPFFTMVGRDGISIMLKGDGMPRPNSTQYDWARWDAYINTANPDALYQEYKTADVPFRQHLMDDDDGLRGFEVVDINGYVLFFGRPEHS